MTRSTARAKRVASLISQARQEAADAALDLAKSLEALSRQARELQTMGEAVPVGIRALAVQIDADAKGRAMTVRAIMGRVG